MADEGSRNAVASEAREMRPIGPALGDDEGNVFHATEDEVWNAAACTAGLLILMVAWDFSSHAEWTLGQEHYFFGSTMRMGVRILGVAIAFWIWFEAAREARAAERDRDDPSASEERHAEQRTYPQGGAWHHE